MKAFAPDRPERCLFDVSLLSSGGKSIFSENASA